MAALAIASLALAPLLAPPALAQEQTTVGVADLDALVREGVALVYSSNVVTDDTLRGIAILDQAASQGSVEAQLQLGSLYLYEQLLPRDWAKARAYYELAAEAGNWSGMAEYGMMLMWTERDWKEGQVLLTEAGERGVTSAWVTLAEGAMYGYLGGGQHSRAKYAGYAEKARAAGEPKIEVAEAARYQWGISVKADGAKAIGILTTAADAGNAEAAWALINLLRDGNGLNVGRNRTAAKAAMQAYAPLFSEAQRWQLDQAMAAAEARTPAAMSALAQEVMARGNLVTKDFGPLLKKANLNATVYVLQAKLAAAGADLGAPDGYARPRTLAAMYAACMAAARPASCADSVMRDDVFSALFTMP